METTDPAPRPPARGNVDGETLPSERTPRAALRTTETAPGRRLGPYVLQQRLGAGGMGEVYLAQQTGLARLVALKILYRSHAEGSDTVERFRREARAAARLQHAGIVPIYDVGEEDGVHYYAMEYVRGETLDRWATRAKPSPRRSLEAISAVARALAYAHREGIVHRDIKPQNILMSEQGATRVTDFGLAKDLRSQTALTQSGMVLGTPSYMSPEQAWGTPGSVDARTDVYSLGGVLYFLLTGQEPFSAPTVAALLHHVMAAAPVPVRRLAPQVNRDIETICHKCLEKDPGRRYAGADALADDLERFLEGSPILARPPSVVERVVRTLRRHRAPVAGCLLMLATAGLMGTWVRHREHERLQREAGDRERYRSAQRGLEESRALLLAAESEPSAAFPSALVAARRRLDETVALAPDFADARLARADVAVLAGDWAGAAADLDFLLTRNPGEARARDRYAALAVEVQESGREAGQVLNRARELLRPDPSGADAAGLLSQLRAAAVLGNGPTMTALARRLRQEAGDRGAEDPESLYGTALGLSRGESGDLEAALRLAGSLLKLRPRSYPAHRLLGQVLDALGRREEAAAAFRTALDLQPEPSRIDLQNYCRRLAEVHRGGDDARYRQALEDLVGRYPNSVQALLFLARHGRQRGQPDEAKRWLERAVALEPDNLAVLAEAYLAAVAAQGAESARALLERAPACSTLVQRVGARGGSEVLPLTDALVESHDLAFAQALLQPCLEAHPRDASLLFQMGEAHFFAKNNAEALRCFDAAIEIGPVEASWYFKRARVWRRMRRYPEAARDLRLAVAMSPSTRNYRVHLAVCSIWCGDLDGAIDQFVEAIYLAPFAELRDELSAWLRGEIDRSAEGGAGDAGGKEPEGLLQATVLRPLVLRVAHKLLRRGMAALRQGDERAAEHCFGAAALGLPEWPDSYVAMARLQARRGSPMAAVVLLERSAELGYRSFDKLREDPWLAELASLSRVRRLIEKGEK